MALLEHFPLRHRENTVKQRLLEALAPGAGRAQRPRVRRIKLMLGQLTITEQLRLQLVRGQLARRLGLEGLGKGLQMRLLKTQAGRHRVPAEFFDQARMGGIDRGQGIADMETSNRARRAAQQRAAGFGRGKGNGRPVQPVLDLRGHQADHPRMPVRIEQTGGNRGLADAGLGACHRGLGLVGHLLLDGTALAVDALQGLRDLLRLDGIIGEQQLDAQRHVLQPAGGVDPRRQCKTDIAGRELVRLAPAGGDQGLQADAALAGAQTAQASRHQGAVVGIQRHQIGHGAHRHQVQQHAQVRTVAIGKGPAPAQLRAQRQQHIEHHPDPGQHLARKATAGLVRVDDGIGRRQLRTGQVVVGDQHLPAQCLGRAHPRQAGDAMVHRDQQLRLQRGQLGHQADRQPVTMHDPVGHGVDDIARAEQAQAAHRQRGGGGAIAIEVTHHQDALVAGNGIGQQGDGGVDALQLLRWQQLRQARLRAGQIVCAACGVDALQQGRHLFGPLPGSRRRAADYLHAGHQRTRVVCGLRHKRQRWPRLSW